MEISEDLYLFTCNYDMMNGRNHFSVGDQLKGRLRLDAPQFIFEDVVKLAKPEYEQYIRDTYYGQDANGQPRVIPINGVVWKWEYEIIPPIYPRAEDKPELLS